MQHTHAEAIYTKETAFELQLGESYYSALFNIQKFYHYHLIVPPQKKSKKKTMPS